jgi:hypothetical protein
MASEAGWPACPPTKPISRAHASWLAAWKTCRGGWNAWTGREQVTGAR